ncbi:hypothetical protein DH2020_030592 [Rehmannia glutinosa]|uniref:K Homology domain-containing protein n=1 Tax=Rehmannia glutinosa TaxID=99300 RepID=A0ABR0VPE8_REHGL
MESCALFPPVNRPIYTSSTTMNEPNANNSTHHSISAAGVPTFGAAAFFKRSKPPQPPLFIPPGHVAFRLVCHASRIGGLIGKSGSIIKQLQQLTNSRIRVEDPPESGDHRVISVVSSPFIINKIKLTTAAPKGEEETNGGTTSGDDGDEWYDVSAAQEGMLRVFERVVELAAEGDDMAGIGEWFHVGCWFGRTRIEGNILSVKKALVVITGRLQEFPPLEKTRTYGTSPPETESLPITNGDLSLQRVGGIIGKGGSIVKAIHNKTGASISIGPAVAECDERLITITAMEAGLVKGLDSDSKGSPVSARVLVPSNQVGCLLGKGGAIISEMRKVTGARLSIIGGNQVPKCASENNEVLQITGECVNVQDALYKVTGRLRDNIFSVINSTGRGNFNSLRTEDSAYGRVRDPPPFRSHLSLGITDNPNEHKSLIQSMDQLGISNDKDRQPSPSLLTSLTVSGVNHGNTMDNGGRLPSVKGGVELGSGSRSAIVTNTTVEIVVPDIVIGSIYGENGSNLARLRQISGAKVIVHEPHPGTTHRIIVISGSPDETQAAQSLLQAFILAGS